MKVNSSEFKKLKKYNNLYDRLRKKRDEMQVLFSQRKFLNLCHEQLTNSIYLVQGFDRIMQTLVEEHFVADSIEQCEFEEAVIPAPPAIPTLISVSLNGLKKVEAAFRAKSKAKFTTDLKLLESGELDLIAYLEKRTEAVEAVNSRFEKRLAGYKRAMQDLKGVSTKNNSLYHEVISESVDKYWQDLAAQDNILL